MITTKNKKDAIEKMKQLGLNYFPLEVFDVKNIEEIQAFFAKNKGESFIARNPSRTNAKYYYVDDFEQMKKLLPKFKKEVTLGVSYKKYKEDIVLLGDVNIHKNDMVELTARIDSEADHRNIYEKPDYNLRCSLDEDAIWRVPGFDKLAKYIVEHELYDIVVEFGVFSRKLGCKKDNVVVFELRSGF